MNYKTLVPAIIATAAAATMFSQPAHAASTVAAPSAAGWTKFTNWTLQPGVGGVEVKGKTRWRKVNGKKQADIRVSVRDTDLHNKKNACAVGLAYLKPVGSRTGRVCAGKAWKTYQAGGWGLKSVRIQECVDNSWSFEKCSKFKVVFKD